MALPDGSAPAPATTAAADRLRRVRALAVLLLLAIGGLVARRVWRARDPGPAGLLVEVGGAVERPGLHALPPGASARDALAASVPRVPPAEDPFLDLPLHDGYRVVLGEDGAARVELARERLLVGLPVDVNAADADLLEQLPGVGPALAAAIVADREARGPFRSPADLERVKGIGPATLARIAPLVVALPRAEEPEP